MISEETLKKNLYDFLETPAFKAYEKSAKASEQNRVLATPRFFIKEVNGPNHVYQVQITYDKKMVKVSEDTGYVVREVGFFPLSATQPKEPAKKPAPKVEDKPKEEPKEQPVKKEVKEPAKKPATRAKKSTTKSTAKKGTAKTKDNN